MVLLCFEAGTALSISFPSDSLRPLEDLCASVRASLFLTRWPVTPADVLTNISIAKWTHRPSAYFKNANTTTDTTFLLRPIGNTRRT